MSTPGSSTMAIVGFTTMLLSVSVGIHFLRAGGFGLLLGFTGVVTGGILLAVGVRMADHREATVVVMLFDVAVARALAALVRRNTTAVGLIMASCAVTAVSGEAEPMICFATFALLLLGVSLINIGARGCSTES